MLVDKYQCVRATCSLHLYDGRKLIHIPDTGSKFLRNNGISLLNCMASHPRIQ